MTRASDITKSPLHDILPPPPHTRIDQSLCYNHSNHHRQVGHPVRLNTGMDPGTMLPQIGTSHPIHGQPLGRARGHATTPSPPPNLIHATGTSTLVNASLIGRTRLQALVWPGSSGRCLALRACVTIPTPIHQSVPKWTSPSCQTREQGRGPAREVNRGRGGISRDVSVTGHSASFVVPISRSW